MKRLLILLCLLLIASIPLKAADKLFSWQLDVAPAADGKYIVTASCRIAENSYLDSSNTFVTVKMPDGRVFKLTAPPAADSPDKSSKRYNAGTHLWRGTLDGKPSEITADYQGCTTGGGDGDMCLMPESVTLFDEKNQSAELFKKSVVTAPEPEKTANMPEALHKALAKFPVQRKISGLQNAPELIAFIENDTAGNRTPADKPAAGKGFWAVLLLVILGGLGLNLTPCVLPMIPINLAIIGASGTGVSRWQGFRRGGAYALGITLTYGILGVLAAVTGSSFGELNSSSIFNWVIAAIFTALALGMLGVYDIDFSRFGNLLRRSGNKEKRQLPPEISAFLLGIMAALLAGACVAPVVITVIVLAGKLYSEGSSWGLVLPFVLGFAMALPWPLLGAGMTLLPKPGMWMTRVKQLFGVLILAMACYYGYLGWTLYSSGSRQVQAVNDLAQELEAAAAKDQIVLIDCWATWCKNCAAQDKVQQSPEVEKVLKKHNIKVIRFQAEDLRDPAVKAFMQQYELPGLPSMVLLKK